MANPTTHNPCCRCNRIDLADPSAMQAFDECSILPGKNVDFVLKCSDFVLKTFDFVLTNVGFCRQRLQLHPRLARPDKLRREPSGSCRRTDSAQATRVHDRPDRSLPRAGSTSHVTPDTCKYNLHFLLKSAFFKGRIFICTACTARRSINIRITSFMYKTAPASRSQIIIFISFHFYFHFHSHYTLIPTTFPATSPSHLIAGNNHWQGWQALKPMAWMMCEIDDFCIENEDFCI